jgi:YD repeat-containing protein
MMRRTVRRQSLSQCKGRPKRAGHLSLYLNMGLVVLGSCVSASGATTIEEINLCRATSINVPGSGSVGRGFDSLDRITNLTLDGSPVAAFTFRGPSRIDTVTRSTGVLTSTQYDTDRRLTNLSTTSLGTPFSFQGSYDDRHLLTSEDRGGFGDAFAYDHASRLIQSGLNQPNPAGGVNLGGEHFVSTLDAAENWTSLDKLFGGRARPRRSRPTPATSTRPSARLRLSILRAT